MQLDCHSLIEVTFQLDSWPIENGGSHVTSRSPENWDEMGNDL